MRNGLGGVDECIGMEQMLVVAGVGDDSFETLLRPSDVAARLGVSRTWLYDAAKDGRIPSVRLGGASGPLRFVQADLREWLEASRAAWQPGPGAGRAATSPSPRR